MLLRGAQATDLAAVASWLPELERAGCALPELALSGEALLYSEGGARALLLIEKERPMPGAARIRLVAVAPGERRLGVGSRAVLSLEQRLRPVARRIFVSVPADFGLALYFWLRLGYRPLTRSQWPLQPETTPSAWMQREIAAYLS